MCIATVAIFLCYKWIILHCVLMIRQNEKSKLLCTAYLINSVENNVKLMQVMYYTYVIKSFNEVYLFLTLELLYCNLRKYKTEGSHYSIKESAILLTSLVIDDSSEELLDFLIQMLYKEFILSL